MPDSETTNGGTNTGGTTGGGTTSWGTTNGGTTTGGTTGGGTTTGGSETGPDPKHRSLGAITRKTNVFWASYSESLASKTLEFEDYKCMAAKTKTSTTSLILLKN